MRDLFVSMPDSLLPMMTTNNRLDCIDFIENQMVAKVKNRLDEYVELKKLTTDYLLLETSEVSRVEMKLVQTSDTTCHVCVVNTYLGPVADSHVAVFDERWQAVKDVVVRPSVDDFFPAIPTESQEKMKEVLAMLNEMPFLEAKLSTVEPILTWTIGLGELPREDRESASCFAKPVEVKLQ